MSQEHDQAAMIPRKSARQARSAATVAVILEAAARILETAGLAGYTTNAVAERAGVSVGSVYQYFPNKDAITRALIRRELQQLEEAVASIDFAATASSPLTSFITIAVDQQMRRPALARLLDGEEERLGAGGDIEPARDRVTATLSNILAANGRTVDAAAAQDVMALIATLVNVAASRGEIDGDRLFLRVEAMVRCRLHLQ